MRRAQLDANRIVTRLWQGSNPPKGPVLRACGIDVLVLCARELQHHPSCFPGVRVIHAPMDDGETVPVDLALKTAQEAAGHHLRGARILVCCAAGLNRSGLVSALVLWFRFGASGSVCARRVQTSREWALNNDAFTAFLATLPPRRRLRPGA